MRCTLQRDNLLIHGLSFSIHMPQSSDGQSLLRHLVKYRVTEISELSALDAAFGELQSVE